MTTGGTIEKEYSEPTGNLENKARKIDRYLQQLRLPGCDLRTIPLMNLDSLNMVDADRALILASVKEVLKHRAPIVITHGTDTLIKTGIFLKKSLPDLSYPIVMTGAMTPLGFEGSDGLQNLTESIFALQFLPRGVYVVMHGQTFPIDRVRKESRLSRFVPTEKSTTRRDQEAGSRADIKH
jgi:L-asparaginase